MFAQKRYTDKNLIYPGAYTLLPEVEQLIDRKHKEHEEFAAKPPVNMIEFTDHLVLEVSIPGARREDVILEIQDNHLSIIVLNEQNPETGENLQIHEFDSGELERHILFPDNADTEFMCATFDAGVLHFYIPKADHPVKNVHARIVAY